MPLTLLNRARTGSLCGAFLASLLLVAKEAPPQEFLKSLSDLAQSV